MKKIFVINGSASENSSNQKIINYFSNLTANIFRITVFDNLKMLPHFSPALAVDNTPQEIIDFRESIEAADGVLICTPEYIFSIPSGLKNTLEWCVSTTVFANKPTGIITASANGEKGHEELQLILHTLMAKLTPAATLLIQGIKGKINEQGEITDNQTNIELLHFIEGFKQLF